MISDHIRDLITAVKSNPNGINRNKAVSHLEDALAHCVVMEMDRNKTSIPIDPTADLLKQFMTLGRDELCICPDGALDVTCPIHGSKPV